MGVPVDLSSVAASGSSPLGVPIGIAAGINTLGTLLGGALTQGYNRENMALQNEYAKDLMNYQWQNFGSYEAQVKSMQKAGLNPAVLYGKGASSAASPSPSMPSSAPINVPSVFDLSSLSNYMLSVAQAKKAGMDTKLSEQDIKNKEVERQRNEFELDLRKQFGKDFNTVDLANAYMKLVLAADSADLNEQEKALNEWKIAAEKAESKSKEYNRDILKQMLDNNPTKIALENNLASEKIKTEKSAQSANYASASASSASAEQTEIFNKIYSDKRFKHAVITEAVEGGRKAVEERKLTKSQADHMSYMVEQAAFATDMQEFTYWSNQIQSFVHSVGEAASSFYGAGSLRELIRLRQMKPSNLESGKGYYIDNDGLLFKRP